MAAALIANAAAGATGQNDTCTTAAIDTTGANFLVAFVSTSPTTTVIAPTDNKSNTWIPMGIHTQATNNMRLALYVSVPSSVGSGHTFSLTTTNGVPTIAVLAFSGVHSPFGVGTTSSGTSVSTGTVTLAQQASVIATAVNTSADRSATIAVASGFTIADNVAFSASEHFGLTTAYQISAAASSETPDWSWTTATSAVALRIVLNEDASASGGETSHVCVG